MENAFLHYSDQKCVWSKYKSCHKQCLSYIWCLWINCMCTNFVIDRASTLLKPLNNIAHCKVQIKEEENWIKTKMIRNREKQKGYMKHVPLRPLAPATFIKLHTMEIIIYTFSAGFFLLSVVSSFGLFLFVSFTLNRLYFRLCLTSYKTIFIYSKIIRKANRLTNANVNMS